MLRSAVLSAWAELTIQSTHWDYLVEIVRPHIAQLVSLWLSLLTAYAKLQFEPDINDGVLLEDLVIDPEYCYTPKEFLLQVVCGNVWSDNRFMAPAGSKSLAPSRP